MSSRSRLVEGTSDPGSSVTLTKGQELLEPAGGMGEAAEEDFSLWLYMKRKGKRKEKVGVRKGGRKREGKKRRKGERSGRKEEVEI